MMPAALCGVARWMIENPRKSSEGVHGQEVRFVARCVVWEGFDCRCRWFDRHVHFSSVWRYSECGFVQKAQTTFHVGILHGEALRCRRITVRL